MHACRFRPDAPGVADRAGQRFREQAVYLRGGGAEPFGLGGEVTADLVGVQVRFGVEVTDAGEGEPPALGAATQKFLHERERGGDTVEDAVQPGDRTGHVRAAGVGEHAGDLQIRVAPGPQAPEDLQDVGIAVDDRGVGLLGPHRVGGQGSQLLQRVRHEIAVWLAALDERQQGGAAVRVVQAVVHQPVRGLPEQEALVPVGRVRSRHQRYLVAIDQAVIGIADFDDKMPEQRGQPHILDDAQTAPGPPLAGEPALPWQPGGQQADQVRIVARHHRSPVRHRRPPRSGQSPRSRRSRTRNRSRARGSGGHPFCRPYVLVRQGVNAPGWVSANQ